MRDAVAAVRAALEGVRQFLPPRIVFQQLGAFRDGLKHVVQIVHQTFQRQIGDSHIRYYSATRCSVSKNSGKDTEAASGIQNGAGSIGGQRRDGESHRDAMIAE